MDETDRNEVRGSIRSFRQYTLDDVNACLQIMSLDDLIGSKLPLCIFQSPFVGATDIYLYRKVGQ